MSEKRPLEEIVADPKALGRRVVPAPTDPMAVARQFLAERHTGGGDVLLRHFRGLFYAWEGACWPEAEERALQAALYRWLESADYVTAKGDLVPFEPTRNKVGNALAALQAIVHLDAALEPPAWLGEGHEVSAAEIVAMSNGLLHLPTRTLLAHTPAFFSHYALPFPYDPKSKTPRRWLQFLRELWPNDRESIEVLAEIMGYVLGGGTRLQKLLMLIGPKRTGKGTIARVLTGLLGAHNVAAPTLASLTTNFGLQPLVDKPLAIISDARLGTRSDALIAVERLLSISGEDSITVDRKYRDPWTGRLPTRFLILSNELPRLTDSSGALASRFVLLTMSRSFYEREDLALTEKLLAEAPGIFNWALEGLARLTERGHFLQPESAREALRHLEDLSSPVGAFIRDCCELGPAFEVAKDELFVAWRRWCFREGRDRPGSNTVFAKDLRAAVPALREARPGRRGEQRQHIWRGIRLAPPVAPDTPGHAPQAPSASGRVPGHQHRTPGPGGARRPTAAQSEIGGIDPGSLTPEEQAVVDRHPDLFPKGTPLADVRAYLPSVIAIEAKANKKDNEK
jgi:putative DNA primase/helicase